MDGSPNCERSETESASRPVILAGLGYTARRLARRLLLRRTPIFGVAREPHERFRALGALGLHISGFDAAGLPKNALIVHSIPPLPGSEGAAVRKFISALRPKRIVYISTTAVYGSNFDVNAETPVDISEEKARARVGEERWIASGPWSSLILRPGGIYGPGRGMHVRVRDGKPPRGAGSGMVSRIHVDDLAGIIEAGLFSEISGAWPAADEQPCSSDEIAGWCARLLRMNLPEGELTAQLPRGRKVDGSELRALLGCRLTYPGYEAGILASITEERGRAINERPRRREPSGEPPVR